MQTLTNETAVDQMNVGSPGERGRKLTPRGRKRDSFCSSRSALLLGVAALVMLNAAQAVAQNSGGTSTEEIMVTATRRSVNVSRVPINVTALTQKQMDVRSIRKIDDLARFTPDIQYTHTTGVAGNNGTNISIRGIASDVGASTTGIYIDDTPIQVRNIGYWGGNEFPQIFDLDHVEVLRGPQGTLFGASSEGGAIRFITPQPNLTQASGYIRGELADTVHGAPTEEAGIAYGAPLIPGLLAFRFSGWGRAQGGYINRVNPTTGAVIQHNANYENSGAFKLAVTYAPYATLSITPSIYYQDVYDNGRDEYWSSLSKPYADDFNTGARSAEPAHDEFALPAMKIQDDLASVSLISDTSYFSRLQRQTLDYTTYLASFTGNPYYFDPATETAADAYLTVRQQNVTQEFRAQSNDKDALVDWTTGIFFSRDAQREQNLTTPGTDDTTGLLYGRYSFTEWLTATDEETAGYANTDLNLTSKLKLTAGVRVSRDNFNYINEYDGPVVGGSLSVTNGAQNETPVLPKFGVSYQLDPNNFLYATAGEGFRPGGAQAPAPATFCAADLKSLGLTESPGTYNPDSLWSYEAGAKDNLAGGSVRLDSSVYYTKWNNIQQDVRLPSCGFDYVANLGTATSVGGDISASVLLTSALSVGVNAGYYSTTHDQTIYGGSGVILAAKGDRIGGPPLTASAWALYDFEFLGRAAYYRIDDAFHSRTPGVDPATFSYDPEVKAPKANDYLSMRVGMEFGNWDTSAFINNVTNDEVPLSIAHDIAGSSLFYETSEAPMTIGVDVSRKF